MEQEKTKKNLPEVRCSKCRRLLFCGQVKQVEIKCPKCKLILNINGDDTLGNIIKATQPKNNCNCNCNK
ncbi:Com family DNA-binding transcriptional regulator [Selenomonadales bacterium OttesenSCG-928-I06]|nr:Com family DNA-binding transcriptional regulator [Selenomonadales bacterium OttesenSCG-928-I06]